MIKSWIYELMNTSVHKNPLLFDAKTCNSEYAWRLRTGVVAEELGYYGLFFSEHHFSGNRLCPSPNLLVAAVASCTRRLRIGVLGLVLPLWQPWRAAEEIGMLDHISSGRLEIGVARGSNPQEAISVGILDADVEPMYQEALDILELALSKPLISYEGRYWSIRESAVLPRTLQQMPPRWATVRSMDSAAVAARRGYKACTGFLPIEQVKLVFDAYRAAAATEAEPISPDHLAIRRCIFVSRHCCPVNNRIDSIGCFDARTLICSPVPGTLAGWAFSRTG